MEMDYVNAEVFTKTMEEHAPEFDDTWKVASLAPVSENKGRGDNGESLNGYVRLIQRTKS